MRPHSRSATRRTIPSGWRSLRTAGAGLIILSLAATSALIGPRKAREVVPQPAERPHFDKINSLAIDSLTSPKAWWKLFSNAASGWISHKVSTLGAALAYYSVFSIGPLMLIAVSIAGIFFGHDAVRGEVGSQLSRLLGEKGAKGIESMLAGVGQFSEGVFATALGVATLLFAAVGVVVQLKDALNSIWGIQQPPSSGIWSFVRTYAVSMAGVLSVGFLLLVSLLITTVLSAMGSVLAGYLPEAVFHIISFSVSFCVNAVLFAMMFNWLPDVQITWKDVLPGALLTAALFDIGRFLIGFYIGKQGLESTYGASASLVIILIWVYFSAQIVLFGAEFTRAYAEQYGSRSDAAHERLAKASEPAEDWGSDRGEE